MLWALVWVFEPTIRMSSLCQVLLAHKDIWKGGSYPQRSCCRWVFACYRMRLGICMILEPREDPCRDSLCSSMARLITHH